MSESEAQNSGVRVSEHVYVCNTTTVSLNFLQKSKFHGLLICPFLYSVIFLVQKNRPMRPLKFLLRTLFAACKLSRLLFLLVAVCNHSERLKPQNVMVG